ncbi:hypothetical protein [Pseudogulbenkiania sp. MAI-1]|uniref:hypothetical protein n=1 Tax=Pseudogulbenkiania sp. MAI-1 TaxID=990370 RepID=UPI0012EC7F25|nr:hypothetical protein [Pseudogulbenkiania sp. MAI-1]
MIKANLSKAALIDFIFIILPFCVFLMVNAVSGDGAIEKTFYSSEVGFAATILYGQLVAKFVSEVASIEGQVEPDRAALVVTVLVALLLISSIVLAVVLIKSPIQVWVYWVQLFLFVISIYLHFDFYEKIERFKRGRALQGAPMGKTMPTTAGS